MKILFIICLLANIACAQTTPAPTQLKLVGTRTWIKVEWVDVVSNENGFNIYWSTTNKKPLTPGAVVEANTTRYYIQHINVETRYYVWVEAYSTSGTSKAIKGALTTVKKWVLDPYEASNLDIPSSAAVPAGMQLYWHDEFNDELLNRNKWFTTYYSTIDYLKKENFQALLLDSLPQATYKLNGHYIDLFVNDSLPVKAFADGKKISSIQTYNWSTNENLLDNSRGGYFEVRVRRGSTGTPKGVNTAFWFDSPGPDLKYYLQEGTKVDTTIGIRPDGQVFEIDIFEYLTAQFVMHGRVDSNGRFLRNLATDIATDYVPQKHVPGKEWVTFGLLWTPTSLKHYIDGKLIKAYDDKQQVYAPNHFMNVLLGSYGAGGTVNMEVDYIRYYCWPLTKGNELPNGGAEYSSQLAPWEGTATISRSAKRSGTNGFLVAPGQSVTQHVYLNHSKKYDLRFWSKGAGTLEVMVNNVKQVSGKVEDAFRLKVSALSHFSPGNILFKTGAAYGENRKTVKICFINTGSTSVMLDDVGLYPVP